MAERNTPRTQTPQFIGSVFKSCTTIETLSSSTLCLFKEVVVVVVVVVVLVVVVVVVVVVLARAISHCRRCSHIANRAHKRAYIVKNVLKIEHYVITVENDWSNLKFKPSLSVKCQSTNQ